MSEPGTVGYGRVTSYKKEKKTGHKSGGNGKGPAEVKKEVQKGRKILVGGPGVRCNDPRKMGCLTATVDWRKTIKKFGCQRINNNNGVGEPDSFLFVRSKLGLFQALEGRPGRGALED